MKVIFSYEQEWDETYIKYGGDDEYNYFVWIGSRTMSVYRFMKLKKTLKRQVHITDIAENQLSNDPF